MAADGKAVSAAGEDSGEEWCDVAVEEGELLNAMQFLLPGEVDALSSSNRLVLGIGCARARLPGLPARAPASCLRRPRAA